MALFKKARKDPSKLTFQYFDQPCRNLKKYEAISQFNDQQHKTLLNRFDLA